MPSEAAATAEPTLKTGQRPANTWQLASHKHPPFTTWTAGTFLEGSAWLTAASWAFAQSTIQIKLRMDWALLWNLIGMNGPWCSFSLFPVSFNLLVLWRIWFSSLISKTNESPVASGLCVCVRHSQGNWERKVEKDGKGRAWYIRPRFD